MANAIDVQIGGSHYKKYKIQPAEYCHVNRLGNLESYAVKYVTRWRDKGGLEDIRKAIHCLELLIELEEKYEDTGVRGEELQQPGKSVCNSGHVTERNGVG